MYASFLGISRALHLDIFEQPAENCFFKQPPRVLLLKKQTSPEKSGDVCCE
jgi:hypothetical protein